MAGLITWAVEPTMRVWQAPPTWTEALAFSPVGGGLALALLLGGNLASAYARYGARVSGPQVGAIAVMGRRGGGHVGVVSGIDANGNPIIVSGNHDRTVAESVYPAGRIHAYVLPGS